jgi:hypothetical protein
MRGSRLLHDAVAAAPAVQALHWFMAAAVASTVGETAATAQAAASSYALVPLLPPLLPPTPLSLRTMPRPDEVRRHMCREAWSKPWSEDPEC